MMYKNLKTLLNLIEKHETDAILFKKIEDCLLNESGEFKRTVQQLQQALDLIESLKFVVLNNKREYDEPIYSTIISKINQLLGEIRLEILKLKMN